MYTIRVEQSFDAAHFLKGYEGKCSNIHGHRWRVVAECSAEQLIQEGQERGMVTDFGDLKHALATLCDCFDHSLIYEAGSLRISTIIALQEEHFRLNEVLFRPTAEEFARWFYDELCADGLAVSRVEVWETPNNCASYSPS